MKRIIAVWKRFYLEAKEFYASLKSIYREFRFCSIAFLVCFTLTPCLGWGLLEEKNAWFKASPAIGVAAAALFLSVAYFLLNRIPIPDVTPPPVILPLPSDVDTEG
jgi:hypothetical protein